MSPSPEMETAALPATAMLQDVRVPTPPLAGLPARLQQRLWSVMRWVSAGGVFLMMLVAFADVMGRKAFGQPLRGSVELTELLMLLVVFLGVAMVSREQTHVQLDLIDEWVPRRWQGVRVRVGEFLAGLVMLGAGWLAFTRALQAAREGEITALLRISLAPAYYVVAALLAIAALAHIVHAFAPASMAGKDPS